MAQTGTKLTKDSLKVSTGFIHDDLKGIVSMNDEKKKDITKTQYQTLNCQFQFKGEEVGGIVVEFYNWCKEMEDRYDCVLLMKNDNFNSYWPIDRTRTKD